MRRRRPGDVSLVVNTHWHSDHVGANALLQAASAGVAASVSDAHAVTRQNPGCCQAEYLDQPVSPYTVEIPLHDGQKLRLGHADWEIVGTPGHTPGHVSLWQAEERLLVVGDALSDYDVGWVNLALDGPDAADTALASLRRLADLKPRMIMPKQGAATPCLDVGRLRTSKLIGPRRSHPAPRRVPSPQRSQKGLRDIPAHPSRRVRCVGHVVPTNIR
jgi:glyoxylase-like metal-dependent hydrolase (beta-lactamase superfamily II)